MRLVYFDIESTGVDPYLDRIVELCLVEVGGRHLVQRFNPGVPIPPGASAVHGIYDEDVTDLVPFSQLAPVVQEIVSGAVLCGYNIRRFDTIIIDAELRRAGEPGLPRNASGRLEVEEVDLYQVWQRLEPRNLTTAARRFAGFELEDAHSAAADTEVLPGVLAGMCEAFGLDVADPGYLIELSVPENSVDRDYKFKRNDEGQILLNFGQQRGELAEDNPGLLRWMLEKDFSPESKGVAREILAELEQRARARR